jgi:hypothetical protein
MAAWLARNSLDLQSIFESIADKDTSYSPEQIFRNELLSQHEISHEQVWRNFARECALGKSIAAGKGTLSAGACTNTQPGRRELDEE